MLKRILYGSGAMGALTVGYFLGSVSLSGALAQTTAPSPAPAAQSQTAPTAKEQPEPNDQADTDSVQHAQGGGLDAQAEGTDGPGTPGAPEAPETSGAPEAGGTSS